MAYSTDTSHTNSPTYTPFVLSRLLRPNYLPGPTQAMAAPSKSSTLSESVAMMSSLSLAQSGSVSSIPRDDNESQSTSAHAVNGVSAIVDTATRPNGNKSDPDFVKGYEADDVFGNNNGQIAESKPRSPGITDKSVVATDEKPATPASKHAPRADRVNSPITPANAQGLLPPEACVFVANLSMMRTDEQLEFSCRQAFDLFGNCVVKVRRDRHKHPFALVQYYNNEDASRAVQGAHDLLIDGRRIRTEPAQAKRTVVLSKIGGGIVDPEDARKALEQYGPIEKLYPTTHADARKFGCPEGMWVEFAYYLDFKDAMRDFNATNQTYRLLVPPEIEPRLRGSPQAHEHTNSFRSPRSSTDQKSIFLGNLPHDAAENELRDIFSAFGEIKTINIIHKPVHGSGYNVFGFVEFSSSEEADHAAQQEIDVRGQRIRVEPKEYSARRHTRLQHYSPMSSYGGGRGGGRYGFYHMNAPFGMHHASGNHSYYHGGYEYAMPQRMSPYHNDGYNVFHTPPASNRMPPRRNNMGFSGSPHGIPIFTPASLPPPPPPFSMDQQGGGDDSNYGSHHIYQGNC